MTNKKLTIAIQKKGKLSQKSLKLLRDAGLEFQYSEKALKTKVDNFEIDLIFLRDDDIPELVQKGILDLGIVGQNEVQEKQVKVKNLLELNFSKCRLSIAVPKKTQIENIQSLNGLKIATSYPKILKKFLNDNKIQAEIVNITGSVELSPFIGLSDCICDLVSTGATLESHSLKELQPIFNSQAVLVSSQKLSNYKNPILKDLLFRIKSVLDAKDQKYILVNIPNSSINQIQSLIPGMEKPTISPLSQPGWSSMQSVIETKKFWQISKNLKEFGAKDILLMPIENIIA